MYTKEVSIAESRRRAGVDVDRRVAEYRGADGGAQRRVPVRNGEKRAEGYLIGTEGSRVMVVIIMRR